MYENIKNFTRNNKSNIIISSVFILSVYLIKLGTLATSIDNEAAISVSSSLYTAWLSMGRIALVYLKKVFGVGIYNPFLSMFMLIVLMIFSIITWGMIFDYIKNNLIDHQAQGEKYNSDNSKILDNFSESIGKDFVMYFEIFSIICVPVYL